MFSSDLLRRAARHFHADCDPSIKLGEQENFVFEVKLKNGPAILRMTHSSHRSIREIEEELDFFVYLHQCGVQVCRPLGSAIDRILPIPLKDGSFFYCCLFEKARGNRTVPGSPDWTEQLFYEWGRSMASMHAVAKNYHAGSGRKQFKQDAGEKLLMQRKKLTDCLSSMPRQEYGLIHGDLHSGNFFFYNGKLQIFDFDDSSPHWFASDLAIPVYYYAWFLEVNGDSDSVDKCRLFFKHLSEGYQSIRPLTEQMASSIPLFLKVRDFMLYAYFHKKYEIGSLERVLQNSLQRMEKRIMNNEEIVKMEWGKYAGALDLN
nr:phosphotransferase [Metabacillus mangrovi]